MNYDWTPPTLKVPPSRNLESRILIAALKKSNKPDQSDNNRSSWAQWGIAASTLLTISLMGWNQHAQYKTQQEFQLAIELFSQTPSFELVPEAPHFANVDFIISNAL